MVINPHAFGTSGGGGGSISCVGGTLRPYPGTITRPWTVAAPAGLADDDVLVAVLAHSSTGITITPPAGFTEVFYGGLESTASLKIGVYVKTVTDAVLEPASYDFTGSLNRAVTIGLVALRGVDLGTRVADVNLNFAFSGTSVEYPSVACQPGDAVIFAAAARYDLSGSGAPPSGATIAFGPGGTSTIDLVGAYELDLSGSATGARPKVLAAVVGLLALSLRAA